MAVDRMSSLDASFLSIEDSFSHMHIASVSIFEGPVPPFADIVGMVEAKLHLIPRYRQVVRSLPWDLGRPVWADDPYFNIEYHIRHTALPTPGGEGELQKLIGRLMGQQLDRSKPLWEIWIIDGLDDGKWALFCKVHHSMVDGISGTDLLSVVMNITPEITLTEQISWEPRPAPNELGLVVNAFEELMRAVMRPVSAIATVTRLPGQAVRQIQEVARGLGSMAEVVRSTPVSSLNGPIGPHRRYAWASTSVDEVKAVRRLHGGTFNDVVLTAITLGFRDLLLSRGESVDRVVRSLVPVSVRPRDGSGLAVGDGTLANKVSAMFADLPVGILDPVDCLHFVSTQMEDLKEANEALAGEALTSMSGFAPPMLLSLGIRLLARLPQRNLNTITTNVPGPQIPLYVQGRKMIECYPCIPIAGQIRFGLAIFSYNGRVNFGITGDYDSTADIEVLCRGIEDGMAALGKAP
jgi:WS/DGAT/MGAT family acyltransferase